VQQLEQEAKKLMTQLKSEARVESSATQPQPQAETKVAPDTADILNRSLEIARLEARISKDWDAYQKRPRRRFVGARTQEYRFARYIEDWRLKVERIGTLNYPQTARDQKIYGSLQLTVSIKADGTVDKVEINRSSGQKVLDQAALRIVELAAPYASFPPDILQDTDILSITRTWTFARSDQLFTE
jgi:protein TonB